MGTQHESSSKGTPFIVTLIIGLAMAVGGFYVSKNFQPAVLRDLAEMGLPIDLGKTASTLGVFIILFPVIRTFFITPLANAINDRTQALEATFTEAENLRAEMTKMKSDYEARLTQTETEARERIQQEVASAQELRKQLEADAQRRADELVHRAQEEIAQERNKVLGDLRLHVANLSLQATEQLLGANMDNDRNRKLVDEFLSKVEVRN